ncbi:MAG: zinc ribbon domain-containing protein [Oscillospiraceae bacterium]|nr:zinc ribbon domain-containing protein [Oscillospiraceae bacterium]MBQ9250872.1 zinc ribbon domain-containing protein [Oscillospiraceae bacterium]
MAKFCPRCGAPVQPRFAFCPKCGAALPALPEEPAAAAPTTRMQEVQPTAPAVHKAAETLAAPNVAEAPATSAGSTSAPAGTVTFQCMDSGVTIATAAVPEGFSYAAKLFPEDFNDFSPLRDAVMVYNKDLGITIRTDSKVFWEEYMSVLMKQGAALGGINPDNEAAFREPEDLMQAYGKPSENAVLVPAARATLPGWFAQNGQTLLNAMIQQVIDSDQLVSNVKTEILNAACEPIMMRFVGKENGKDIVVLVGCEFMGFECRNAISPLTMMGGTLGLIGGLMSMKQSSGSGQIDGSIPLGHSRDFGKKPDIIHWGYNRIYSCVTPPEREREATEAFLRFVVSFRPDAALQRRRAQREAEIQMQTIQRSNGIAAQARHNQMLAQQRAMETSRMIARNSAEISAGIMDSWNQKMASDSRISEARSEAIRGVNTYQTTYGSPVEVSVAADHVYQNNYGDVYGVSGSAVDQELLNRLDWTEIHQK